MFFGRTCMFLLKTVRFRLTKRGARYRSVFDVKCAVFGFNAFDLYLRYLRSPQPSKTDTRVSLLIGSETRRSFPDDERLMPRRAHDEI